MVLTFVNPHAATGYGCQNRNAGSVSANILDFSLPQKHVLMDNGGRGRPSLPAATAAQGASRASIRERAHGGFVR